MWGNAIHDLSHCQNDIIFQDFSFKGKRWPTNVNIKYDKQGGEFEENRVDYVSAEFGRNTGCTEMVHNISFSFSVA